MASARDYLLDDDQDLIEDPVTMDFVEDLSDDQHIRDILQLEAGELKYDPLMGVGIEKQINGMADNGSLKKQIMLQMEADNYNVKLLTISNQLVDIDAERKS